MKYIITRKIALSCCLFISILSAQAQTNVVEGYSNKELGNMSLEDALKINMTTEVTSVSKNAENALKAPTTLTIVTDAEIRQRGYTNLSQVLGDLPGFDFSTGNGVLGSQIYMRGYRSNNTDRILFMIDGVEENDLWSYAAWLDFQYPLSNIKHVEVVYGPSSTMYGPNAFLGVVNVVTKNAEDIVRKNRPIGVSAQVNYGSWNTRYADVTLAGKKDNVSFTLTGRKYLSDEMNLSKYPDFDYKLTDYNLDFYKTKLKTTDDALAQKAMDLDNQGYFNTVDINNTPPTYSNNKNDYLVNGKLKVDNLTLGFQTWKRNDGVGMWYRDTYEAGPKNGGRWVPNNSFAYVRYEKNITDRLSIMSFTRYHIHRLSDESRELYFVGYLNGGLTAANLSNADGKVPYWDVTNWSVTSNQMRSEFKANYAFSSKWNLMAGTEYRSAIVQGAYLSDYRENVSETATNGQLPGGNHFYIRDIGFYSQLTYKPIPELSISAGGRIDNNKIRVNGGYGTVVNPKLAVVYAPAKLILKAMYAEAFKDAGNAAKYSTTPGRLLNNPTLQPEKIHNIELSATYFINKNFKADLVAYHATSTGAIGTANVSFVDPKTGNTVNTTQNQAVGSLRIQGIQANLNYTINNYSAYANYTIASPYDTQKQKRVGDIASHAIRFGLNAT